MQETKFIFVLLEGYSALSMTSAVETLRITNDMLGSNWIKWVYVSETGGSVTSSQGQVFQVDSALSEIDRNSIIVVCGGVSIAKNSTPGILSWLRRQAVFGAQFCGLCTAASTLAEAGLLNGKRATIHWQEVEWFRERYPNVILSESTFERDGKVSTTAGGVSSIDLFLEILADIVGDDVVEKVADRLMYRSIRTIQSTAKISRSYRVGFHEPRLIQAIAIMERNLEEPINPSTIASTLNISTRQLERIFRKYLNSSPGHYSMVLRLERSMQLLVATDMSIIEVAIACGFNTQSHFSKCFKREYGRSPLDMRRSTV